MMIGVYNHRNETQSISSSMLPFSEGNWIPRGYEADSFAIVNDAC